MSREINFGNAVEGTGNAVALFPDRPYAKRTAWVQHLGATANMVITAPSGSVYQLRPGRTLFFDNGSMEGGAYTITANAADTYSFWESN